MVALDEFLGPGWLTGLVAAGENGEPWQLEQALQQDRLRVIPVERRGSRLTVDIGFAP
jgi:hypothetical protein